MGDVMNGARLVLVLSLGSGLALLLGITLALILVARFGNCSVTEAGRSIARVLRALRVGFHYPRRK
jgi:hypothetical protein